METLPVELMASIMDHLDLSSAKAIRLCNRAIRGISLEGFKKYVKKIQLPLHSGVLNSLVWNLKDYDLACYVEEIVFVGYSKELEEHPDRLLNLLKKLLTLAKSNGRLHSTHLDSKQRESVSLLLLALQTSQLPLLKLSLFTHGGHHTVAITDYPTTTLQALAPCLKTVTEFSWSLTTAPRSQVMQVRPGPAEDELAAEEEKSAGRRDITTIKKVLDTIQAVEKLDLLWYRKFPRRLPEAYFFEDCSDSLLKLERLRDCSLRGLYVTEEGLLNFLLGTQATAITLRATRLRTGNYRTILDVITSGKFNRFVLDDLYEFRDGQYVLIVFKVVGRSKFGSEFNIEGPSLISREGSGTRMQLEYGHRSRPRNSSVSDRRHVAQSLAVYGSDQG